MEWILHPRICAFPDLAQALCSPLRGWLRLTRYCVFNNINRILQQVLQQHALDIAKQYQTQDRHRWVTAAEDLRAPYWDWATNSVPPPEVVSMQSVKIITPDGKTTSVPNPLYQYTFNPIDQSFPSPWKFWKTTIRHPDHPNRPDATTDVPALKAYDIALPDPSVSFILSTTANFSRSRTTLPQVPTTFSRVLIPGQRSATTPQVMAAALATPSKPYMTRFMVSLAVRWDFLK
jgi:hypothetical protein